MRWLIALLFLTSTAYAEGQRFAAFGLGTSVASNEPGWALRAEHRFDSGDPDENEPLFGARIGLDMWDAGGHWGIAMPLGTYLGAQVGSMRTTIGGGIGLWTFEKSGGEVHFGISPFASASLEGSVGKLLLSLDGRLSRQVIGETADFNVYSVMLMVGKRFTR
ncbi:MAG: hypothetical protein M4D80_13625 [Myxococcota bacterium]|nr:hypothetical protein [Myxococcota bacterium]